MHGDNIVSFKGIAQGIIIQLDPQVNYDIIKEVFINKIQNFANFFDKPSLSVIFQGKELSDEQQKELLTIISDNTSVNTVFVKTISEEVAEKTDSSKAADKKASLENLLALQPHNSTKFFKGNIRSGRVIDFEGSVVVIGDVNPGAEVRAGGNIIILGSLKGLAHAGADGMQDAFVAALVMAPVQLRIADIITRFPEEDINRLDKTPEYASIEDGQIYVVPLI